MSDMSPFDNDPTLTQNIKRSLQQAYGEPPDPQMIARQVLRHVRSTRPSGEQAMQHDHPTAILPSRAAREPNAPYRRISLWQSVVPFVILLAVVAVVIGLFGNHRPQTTSVARISTPPGVAPVADSLILSYKYGAIKAQDGTVLWQNTQGISSFQPILHNGVLYARGDGDSDHVDSPNDAVWATATADGKELWRTPLHARPLAMTMLNDTIFVFTYNSQAGIDNGVEALVALRSSDGALLWQNILLQNAGGQLGLDSLVANSHLLFVRLDYVRGQPALIEAIRPEDGKQVWRVPEPEPYPAGLADLLATDTTLFGFNSLHGPLWVLRTGDGALLWQRSDIKRVYVVENNVLYAAKSDTGGLIALRLSDGATLWQRDDVTFAPTLSNGVLYAGGQGSLWALNALDGTTRWQHPLQQAQPIGGGDSAAFAPPFGTPIVKQGVIFVATYCVIGHICNAEAASGIWAISAADGAVYWLNSDIKGSNTFDVPDWLTA